MLGEELAAVGAASLTSSFSLQDDVFIPYLLRLGTDEQQRRWLPRGCAGELIGAVAMTEPSAGSDLQGIKTTATPQDRVLRRRRPAAVRSLRGRADWHGPAA